MALCENFDTFYFLKGLLPGDGENPHFLFIFIFFEGFPYMISTNHPPLKFMEAYITSLASLCVKEMGTVTRIDFSHHPPTIRITCTLLLNYGARPYGNSFCLIEGKCLYSNTVLAERVAHFVLLYYSHKYFDLKSAGPDVFKTSPTCTLWPSFGWDIRG